MTISDRLDEAMTDAGKLSQAELSRRSGVPQPTINRILKGKGKKGPETATLVALARALKVEFLWLQQGAGPKPIGPNVGSTTPTVVPPPEQTPPRFLRHWLNDDEAEILALYRSLSESNQRITRLYVQGKRRETVRRDDTGDQS